MRHTTRHPGRITFGIIAALTTIAYTGGGPADKASAQDQAPPPEFAANNNTCTLSDIGSVSVRSKTAGTLIVQYRQAGVWTTITETAVAAKQVITLEQPWDMYARGGRSVFRAGVSTPELSWSEPATCTVKRGDTTTPVPPAQLTATRNGYCRAQSDGRVATRATGPGVLYLQTKTETGWQVVATLRAEQGTTVAYPKPWKDYVLNSGQTLLRVYNRDSTGWSKPAECSISADSN
jgi:hypothetical protein